jgi:filamentous hemagglutinin
MTLGANEREAGLWGTVVELDSQIAAGYKLAMVLPAADGSRGPKAAAQEAAQVQPLDWSIVSKTGETRPAHVGLQETNILQKQSHGVFYGDSLSATDEGWAISQRQGVLPVTVNGADIYVVPRPNSGWAGGFAGQGQNLNSLTIITKAGTNKIITAFPGNGLPLPGVTP